MSEGLHVECRTLQATLVHIGHLIPRGSTTINLTVQVQDGVLTFTVIGTIVYRAIIGEVDYTDFSQNVQYYDVCSFIGDAQEFTLTPDPNGIEFSVKDFKTYFVNSYDLYTEDVELTSLDAYDKIDIAAISNQLKAFTKAFSIFKFYKREFPVIIKDNTCVLKTPSVWFKGVCNLPVSASFSPDVIDLLMTLHPTHMRIKESFLQIATTFYRASIPMNFTEQEDGFKEVHGDYTGKCVIPSSKLSEILSAFAKCQTQTVNMLLDEAGMRISVNSGFTRLDYTIGQVKSTQHVCELTKDIFCFLFKMFTTSTVLTIYYKRNVLCLYANDIIAIVTTLGG